MVLFFRRNPFFFVLIPLLSGVYLGAIVPYDLRYGLLVFCVFLLLQQLIFLIHKKLTNLYRYRWLAGVLFTIGFVSLGVFNSIQKRPIEVEDDCQCRFKAEIIDVVGYSEKYIRCKLNLNSDSINENLDINLMGFIPIADKEKIIPGKVLHGYGTVYRFEQPLIPHQFDYGRYLYYNGYSGTLFVKEYEIIDNTQYRSLKRWMIGIRNRFISIFQNEFEDLNKKGVIQSLVLGDRDSLSKDMKEDYVHSGAVHLLAVSGLHVGIIFLLLKYILSFLKRGMFRIFKIVLIIIILWFYAWLTQFSPSVWRATIMFSIVLIGKESRRDYNIYNTLCASAVVILLFDPLAAYNVGFWLSHMAVLGISVFYQPVYNLVNFNFVLLRWIWSIIALSVSAQITTLPIIFYFFEGFPIYFALSNVLLLPVLSAVLIGGILTLLIPVDTIIHEILVGPLSDLVGYMNHVVEFISNLPNAYLTRFSISFYELILLYGVLLFLFKFFEFKRIKYLYLGQIALLGVLVIFISRFYLNSHHSNIHLYSYRGKECMNIIDGRKNILIHNSQIDSCELEYMLSGIWNQSFSYKCEYYNLDSMLKRKELALIETDNLKIGLIKGKSKKTSLSQYEDLDMIIYIGDLKNIREYEVPLRDHQRLILFPKYIRWGNNKVDNSYSLSKNWINMEEEEYCQVRF